MSQRTPLVLIVDDDPGARLLQSTALESGGFAVITADNGAAALDIFHNTQPDCLVVDVIMPGLNGYELCSQIRRSVVGRHVPILILTSLDDLQSINLAYAAGASDFAQKGIAPLLLVERVRFLMRAAQLQNELLESEARLAEAQRIARIGHWEFDLDGHTISVSPVTLDILSLSSETAQTYQALRERIVPEEVERLDEAVRNATGSQTRFGIDLHISTPDGEQRYVHVEGQISDRGRTATQCTLVVTLQDLTSLRRVEERARFLAYFDTQTGLPNAAFFRERLAQALADARERESQVAVIVLDIESLNRLNDSLGTAAGDALLMQLGHRLSQSLGKMEVMKDWGAEPTFTVARFGGDEFAVLLAFRRRGDYITHALRELQDIVRAPFLIKDREVTIGVTMGVAAFPDDAAEGDVLLRLADAALHQAKQTGRGSCQFYSAKLRQHAARRHHIESDLRLAASRDQLELHFQPRLALDTLLPTGVEALVRWRHPERGLVRPAEFVPIAEELGLISEIGEWVLHEATRLATRWAKAGHPLSVAVNVSTVQFQRSNVMERVSSILMSTQLDPSLLELEITEGVLIENSQRVLRALESLKAQGVRLSLDDFGTGYSSLSYLRRLPVDCLKIDRSFIADLDQTADGGTLVAAVLALARNLKLRVVAEGVEKQSQLEFLTAHGCDEVQGYLLAMPMPADQIDVWLESSRQQHEPIEARLLRVRAGGKS